MIKELRGFGFRSEYSEIKPMLKDENIRNDFKTSYPHRVTMKAEKDSLMPTQMRACTTHSNPTRAEGPLENPNTFKLPSAHGQGKLFSAMSITHQHYQEHPLLTNHSESGNLQGSSSMCWQKQTVPKGWILEEAHGGASTHQARIFRSHSAGRAFLILVFSKLFAQKHAFNAELSIRPWTQRQGEENISEFLPYPWWEYQLPL